MRQCNSNYQGSHMQRLLIIFPKESPTEVLPENPAQLRLESPTAITTASSIVMEVFHRLTTPASAIPSTRVSRSKILRMPIGKCLRHQVSTSLHVTDLMHYLMHQELSVRSMRRTTLLESSAPSASSSIEKELLFHTTS